MYSAKYLAKLCVDAEVCAREIYGGCRGMRERGVARDTVL